MCSFHRIARKPAGLAAAAAAAAAALTLSACSGPAGAQDTAAHAANTGDVLNVGFGIQGPPTLDPAKAAQNYAWFDELAYEPLIVQRSNGSLGPGLATSWSYVGSGNTEFMMNLRPGVKFSDGSPLTAQNVVDDFRYVQSAGGQLAPFFTGDTFTATSPTTVTIKAAQPNPVFPQILTQDDVVGGVISEKGLHSPSLLGTQTFGAGPYMLSPSQTVTGSQYTYVPNPHYYDKSAQHWKKVVVKVITDPQSMLSALKTGQVQVANGDPTTVTAARQAGLTVTNTQDLWEGVTLADRDGAISRPLASAQVRQALNYATDRSVIAKALYPGTGSPSSQLSVRGGYGYQSSLTSAYPYNVTKARQLLSSAGYPHGFTLQMVTAEYGGMNLMAQALAQQWRKVGVNLQVTDYANEDQYYAQAFAAKYPAFMTVFGEVPVWVQGQSLVLPPANYNPFHTSSAQLSSLYAQEATSSGSQQTSLGQQIQSYLVKQAWFVPVVTEGLPYYAASAVKGVSTSPRAPLLELDQVQPAG
jgi:peptide/nickel transport system substrate-binding protein